MENRKVIYTFGLLFSLAFALIYYGLFHIFTGSNDTVNIYYNQVGLYKSNENAAKNVATLKDLNIDAYILSDDELHHVICGINTDQKSTKENGAILAKNNINFIEKSAAVKKSEVIEAQKAKDMDKILEMIKNESEGNEQAGTTAGESDQ